MNLDRNTLRWLLEVAGLAFLLVACLLHSWTWDAAGVGLLLLSVGIVPPAGLKGALVASLLTTTPVTLTNGRTSWDIADSEYVRAVQEATDQYDFLDILDGGQCYRPCDYRRTPCGRATSVRAWGDCH